MSKPLGHKSYGSIPHLSSSRLGPGDHRIEAGQERILTEKKRDQYDHIIVQEKLDGTNVAVANVEGRLVPLSRAGYTATSSKFRQHHLFAHWVRENLWRFEFLQPGERVAGEWLAQAHAIRYRVDDERVFVAFDLMTRHERAPYERLLLSAGDTLCIAPLLHAGDALPVSEALALLGEHGHHGALDAAEGVVYRCERHGRVEFMGKHVRESHEPGRLLPEINGGEAVWNWRPRTRVA